MLHPVLLVLLQVLTTAFVVGFTTPASTVRLAILPLQAIATWQVILNCLRDIHRMSVASVVAGNGPTYFLVYLDMALLSRWSFEAQGPTMSVSENPRIPLRQHTQNACKTGFVQRTYWGLQATLSPRHLNTTEEVKNAPNFRKGGKLQVPARSTFLKSSLTTAIICYFVVDLFSAGADPQTNATKFSADKIPLLTRLAFVTGEEMALRLASTIALWLNIYCIFRLGYSTMALLSVITGLSNVQTWRPPFGSLREAYSIRRFWGIFWHQCFRNTFSNPSAYVSHNVLRLPPKGKIPRYTKLIFTFLISGLLHGAVDIALGMHPRESGAVRFFCMQAFGIMLEDGAQELWRQWIRKEDRKGGSDAVFIGSHEQIVGYAWVLLFLVWSSPAWSYPAIRRQTGKQDDAILPFSVIATLRGNK